MSEQEARGLWHVSLILLDKARAKERRGDFTMPLRLATIDAEIAERQQFAALLRARASV